MSCLLAWCNMFWPHTYFLPLFQQSSLWKKLHIISITLGISQQKVAIYLLCMARGALFHFKTILYVAFRGFEVRICIAIILDRGIKSFDPWLKKVYISHQNRSGHSFFHLPCFWVIFKQLHLSQEEYVRKCVLWEIAFTPSEIFSGFCCSNLMTYQGEKLIRFFSWMRASFALGTEYLFLPRNGQKTCPKESLLKNQIEACSPMQLS